MSFRTLRTHQYKVVDFGTRSQERTWTPGQKVVDRTVGVKFWDLRAGSALIGRPAVLVTSTRQEVKESRSQG